VRTWLDLAPVHVGDSNRSASRRTIESSVDTGVPATTLLLD
jgi:hypothetical protein